MPSSAASGALFAVGATGGLGCPTVNKLLAAGHEVPGLARSAESGGRLECQGAQAARASLFEFAALRHAIAGHDAVVNLAARSSRSI
jgi:2-alkyl-3-oxoalkanoate reductase